MQDAGADMTDIHLPERWAVLEQALRQMNAEDASRRLASPDEQVPTNAEASRSSHMR